MSIFDKPHFGHAYHSLSHFVITEFVCLLFRIFLLPLPLFSSESTSNAHALIDMIAFCQISWHSAIRLLSNHISSAHIVFKSVVVVVAVVVAIVQTERMEEEKIHLKTCDICAGLNYLCSKNIILMFSSSSELALNFPQKYDNFSLLLFFHNVKSAYSKNVELIFYQIII